MLPGSTGSCSEEPPYCLFGKDTFYFRHTISLIVNDVIQRILLFSVSSESSFTHLSDQGLKHTLETADPRRKRFFASKLFRDFWSCYFPGLNRFSCFIPTIAKDTVFFINKARRTFYSNELENQQRVFSWKEPFQLMWELAFSHYGCRAFYY